MQFTGCQEALVRQSVADDRLQRFVDGRFSIVLLSLEQVVRIEFGLAGQANAIFSGLAVVLLEHPGPVQLAEQCAPHELVVQQGNAHTEVLRERPSVLVLKSHRSERRDFERFDRWPSQLGQFRFGLLQLSLRFFRSLLLPLLFVVRVEIFVQVAIVAGGAEEARSLSGHFGLTGCSTRAAGWLEGDGIRLEEI